MACRFQVDGVVGLVVHCFGGVDVAVLFVENKLRGYSVSLLCSIVRRGLW
jgi:hypothetical protein